MKDILQKLVTTTSLPEDTYLQQDAEILEIFVEELQDIFDELNDLLPKWLNDIANQDYLKDIRRHFHTLKGSGRMVGANQAGEVAWTVEDLLNRVIAGSILLTPKLQQFAVACARLFEHKLYICFEQQKPLTVDLRPFVLLGHQLRDQNVDEALLILLENTVDLSNAQQEIGAELSSETDNKLVLPNVSNGTLEIYLEESNEYVNYIYDFLQEDEPSTKQTDNLIRALHTLKGSSGMAQIESIFNASSKVEYALKSHLQDAVHFTHDELELLKNFTSSTQQYLVGLKELNTDIIDKATQDFEQAWQNYSLVQPLETSKSIHGSVCELVALNIDHLLDAEQDFERLFNENTDSYLETLVHECDLLLNYTQQNESQKLQQFIQSLKDSYTALKDDPRLYETAGTKELFLQSHQALINYFDLLATGQTAAIPKHAQDVVDALRSHISPADYTKTGAQLSEAMQLMERDKIALEKQNAIILEDKELIDIFLDEAEELLFSIDKDLTDYQQNTGKSQPLKQLMRYLHTLKGGANMIQAACIGNISHALESIYEKLINTQLVPTDYLISILRLVQDQLAERIDIIRRDSVDFSAENTLNILENLAKDTVTAPIAPKSDQSEEVDYVIYESFVEESEELTIELKDIFAQWQEDRNNRSLLLQLQRHAHTIKGGAKMVDIKPLMDVSQALEDTFEKFAFNQVTTNVHDKLLESTFDWVQDILLTKDYTKATTLRNQLDSIDYINSSAQFTDEESKDFVAPEVSFVKGDGTEPPSMLGEWSNSSKTAESAEMIRISSSLIEKMVNLTGENSITRSRIEMGMSQFNNILNEMELAIQRLSDQLRRMDGELETQILAKHGGESSRYQDFDPLEMDQYSSLNQLSKSLAESASDLIDFKVTLTDKVKDAESLLLQQSRIQTEIQDNLMGVHLVPFSRITARLERLVRQTSSTLNRTVSFDITNRNIEIDRNILDRLTTPLEHMLRNAVDHGIENTKDRLAAKKQEAGQISLDIMRQGADVIFILKDDGRGIDVKKIEQKAKNLGLLKSNHELTQQEILQYIFHSGLSTAESVTQISGRGVGLDVVQTDIKALGGHITIESEVGQGSCFTIRIPTTVAVHDALMVKVADQQFAIPLTQIDRIVRISPTILKEHFEKSKESFKIDGQNYKLRYIAEFMGQSAKPKILSTDSLPVLLVKGYNNQMVAILVDQLIGSRSEIVVKPLGAQFAQMDIFSGATILGDGQVCLILDGQNIARHIQKTSRHIKSLTEVKQFAPRARQLVMIVDDSVTVRKVTSRLLERNGYDVVTAKDGIDAVEQLGHTQPDLMLLDIEMPRMDGFEVTNQLRHDGLHHDLPIIMITSRTGEKHRERAFNLGVNHYMGKPFQEAELLKQVKKFLDEKGV